MAPSTSAIKSSGPTETSPLLSRADRGLEQVDPEPIDAGTESLDEDDDLDDGQDGGDVERQISNQSVVKYQGMPEVKKRMKYIFPAIAIGVSKLLLSCFPCLPIRKKEVSFLAQRLYSQLELFIRHLC